jgi:hypothetical protein
MSTSAQSRIRSLIAIIAGVAILLFIISRIFPLVRGPHIDAINLDDVQYQDEYFINIEGKLGNTETILINDVRSSIDQYGNIAHTLALHPGRNIIELELIDGFEQRKKYYYTIITPASEIIYQAEYNQITEEEVTEQEEAEATEEELTNE